jgi:hypothetical protein
MLKKEIRKIVFGLIHEDLIQKYENPCEVDCNQIKFAAIKIYKKLSELDILEMYKYNIKKSILDYLYQNLDKSMFMYWVNGTPKKREMRLKEYVSHYYNQMSPLEMCAICEKLNIVFVDH